MLDKDSGWEELKTCNYGGLLFDLNKLPIGQNFMSTMVIGMVK